MRKLIALVFLTLGIFFVAIGFAAFFSPLYFCFERDPLYLFLFMISWVPAIAFGGLASAMFNAYTDLWFH